MAGVGVAAAAALALAGCSGGGDDGETEAPSAPAPSGEGPSVEVEGSTAITHAGDVSWSIELLSYEPASLDEVMDYETEGDPAPPPEGQELALACVRAELLAHPEGFDALATTVQLRPTSGEYAWDYALRDIVTEFWAAGGAVDEPIERTCAVLLVPEGDPLDEIGVFAVDAEGLASGAELPAP